MAANNNWLCSPLLLLLFIVVHCILVTSQQSPQQSKNRLVRKYVNCKEVESNPRRNCKCFKARGNADYDLCALNGIIAAYQVKWRNGKYSKWFVPRLNDVNSKRNLFYRRCYPEERLQKHRVWTYFYSHQHKYILCKVAPDQKDEDEVVKAWTHFWCHVKKTLDLNSTTSLKHFSVHWVLSCTITFDNNVKRQRDTWLKFYY